MKEEWKDVENYERLYKVSTHGRVQSCRRPGTYGGVLKPQKYGGYLRVALSKNNILWQVSIHRLVAKAFLPNPLQKPLVNHKDSNRHNNYVTNLEWATHSEDTLHALNSVGGRIQEGSWNPNAKLTEEDVLEARKLYLAGIPSRELADSYSISHRYMRAVLARKTWTHI